VVTWYHWRYFMDRIYSKAFPLYRPAIGRGTFKY
jgi:hypothetical protein